MVTQYFDINLVPKGLAPEVSCKQYDDELRILVANVWNGKERVLMTGDNTYKVEGTKPDGTGFSYTCSAVNGSILIPLTGQMTVCAGEVPCDINIFDANNKRVGTHRFILYVQPAALQTGTIISSDDFGSIIDAAVQEYLDEHGVNIQGILTDEAKAALITCLKHVVFDEEADGRLYVDALEDALYNTTWQVTNTLTHCSTSNEAASVTKGGAYSATITAAAGYTLAEATVSITMGGNDITSTAYSNGTISIPAVTGALVITITASEAELTGISAVYTQSGTVYDTDHLDELKAGLVVTATYSDNSTATVPSSDYTLSGTLSAGTSTITVTYGETTTTFTVTVTAGVPDTYQKVEYLQSTGSERIDLGFKGDITTELEITMQRLTNLTTQCRIFGTDTAASTDAFFLSSAKSVGGQTYTNVHIWWSVGQGALSSSPQWPTSKVTIKGDKDKLTVGDTIYNTWNTGDRTTAFTTTNNLSVFNGRRGGSWGTGTSMKLWELIVRKSGAKVFHGIPCYRISDDVPGLFDTVTQTFFTNGSGSGGFSVGGDV